MDDTLNKIQQQVQTLIDNIDIKDENQEEEDEDEYEEDDNGPQPVHQPKQCRKPFAIIRLYL